MVHPHEFGPKTPWGQRPGGIMFGHALRIAFWCFLAGPFTASFALLFENPAITLPLAFLAGTWFGRLGAVKGAMPPRAGDRYGLPLAFCWVMLPGFCPFIVLGSLGGAQLTLLRFLPAFYVLGLVPGFVFFEQRRIDRVSFSLAGRVIFVLLLLLPAGCIAHGLYQDKVYAAKRGHGFELVGGFSSTNLKPYDPRVPGAVTARLSEPSSFTIPGTDDLPVLDGAEAAFPVYAAFAAACYPDLPALPEEDLRRYDYRGIREGPLRFSNTIYGFRNLVEGGVDVFFGAAPSVSQRRLAETKGKELVLTPIGREAFVFFVNEENPVHGLSSRQVRDIYSGKVRNWAQVGGPDAEIMAFQRPVNSGSQTIMLRFMGDTEMEPPLKDRYVSGMDGVVERASEYRNAPSAIGYSFRFFLTGLGKRPRVRMLAVDGVMPTAETIRSGAYPHVVNLYAVTVKDNPNPHLAPFLEWMQGDQGQELVEKVGYVRLPEKRE